MWETLLKRCEFHHATTIFLFLKRNNQIYKGEIRNMTRKHGIKVCSTRRNPKTYKYLTFGIKLEISNLIENFQNLRFN